MPLGRLRSIHRYPVKSMIGEVLDRATIDDRGLMGDRRWCVRDSDGKFGSGKSTRRFRKMEGLLNLSARYDGDLPVIDFGTGRLLRSDDEDVHEVLSQLVGRPVTLAREQGLSHFDEGPIHLVTTSTLRALEQAHGGPVDVGRLRPNLVVDVFGQGFVEDGWVGQRIRVGEQVVLSVQAPMPRCVMLDLAQRHLPTDAGLLRTAAAVNDAQVGVVADVVAAGEVAVGDEVRALP